MYATDVGESGASTRTDLPRSQHWPMCIGHSHIILLSILIDNGQQAMY